MGIARRVVVATQLANEGGAVSVVPAKREEET